jgi:TetR/AcrR family transcriptional repressor of nem operon
MTRPREFDPDKALDRAVAMFWERGYAETSMDELVQETGVSRYGFYGTFGSKLDLFEQVLGRYAEKMSRQMMGSLLDPEAGLKEIEAYFRRMPKFAKSRDARKGCLLCNTAVELAPHNRRIAGMVRKTYDKVTLIFSNALSNAVKAGEIKKTKSEINSLARYLTGLMRALSVMARIGTPPDEIKDFIKVGLTALR